MDLGPEEDVLKVTVANPPDTGLADYEELDTSRVFLLKLPEESLEVLKGERITQGRNPSLSRRLSGGLCERAGRLPIPAR